VKIRIKPLADQIGIGRQELRTALDKPPRNGMIKGTISLEKENERYLLGMPVFDGIPYKGKSPIIVPVEQSELARGVLRNTPSKAAMTRTLRSEYQSMVEALLEMKINFQILNLQAGDKEIRRWLSERGCRGAEFPLKKPSPWQLFPRDMFVYFEPLKTILVHSGLFKLQKDRSHICDIIHTELAEGGRVVFSDHHLVTGCHPEGLKKKNKIILRLQERGMKTTILPYPIFACLSREGDGRILSLYYEFHFDRSASLLKGRDGEYYLVLDPGYRTGSLMDPLAVQKSVDLARKECERHGVHVRVPRSFSTPYSTSAVQFDNGKVLVTGGDEEVLNTFADIVGSENLHVTDVPISAYPVFGAAGLHCLITENPGPLI
jgi:hypothetical protein